MSKDQIGLLAIILFVAGVVAGFMGYTTVAWVLVIAGIAAIVFAMMRK